MRDRHLPWVGALACLVALPCLADYPEKPVRMVTPFVAGGLGDSMVRMIAERLSRSLGQPFVIEARPGADGQIAASEARRAPPDGYTLLFGETASLSMVPAVRKEPPYDVLNDFTPVSHVAAGAFFLFIHPAIPAQTMAQFIAHARANPGKVVFASTSAPSLLATTHVMRHARISMLHVPYKGEPTAMPDMLSGRVQFMIATPFLTAQPAKEGKLRAMAAMLPQRSAPFPDLPTLDELGFPSPPQISWVGLFGPARLPAPIVAKLSAETNAALSQPSLRDELVKRGAVPRGSSPEELRTLVRTQLDFWQAAVKEGLVSRH
jgi:tripartite-type tricarboxylate transporter receptor subunit TctC